MKTTHEQSAPSDPLDQVNFVLNDKTRRNLIGYSPTPPGPNEALRELMVQDPPWEASQG